MNRWDPTTITGRAFLASYKRERRKDPHLHARELEQRARYREANRAQLRADQTSEAYRQRKRERDARYRAAKRQQKSAEKEQF